MKLFLDSAHLEDIEKGFALGVIDGVTTNPSLIKKEMQGLRITLEEYIKSILRTAKSAPVSVEVSHGNAEEMFAQAIALWKRFKKKDNNLIIKIPVNPTLNDHEPLHLQGIAVVKKLTSQGIPTNVTLVFTPEQALLAAKAGATYVSPFVGRIDDFIRTTARMKFSKEDYFPAVGIKKRQVLEDNGIVSGVDLVEKIVTVFARYSFSTQVLSASLRNVRQVRECAYAGSHVATVPWDVIEQLTQHKKTMEGMNSFVQDLVPEYNKLMER